MNSAGSGQGNRPIFSSLGLIVLTLAIPVAQLSTRMLASSEDYTGYGGIAPAFIGAGICFLLTISFCVISVVRKEQPAWVPLLTLLTTTLVIAFVAITWFG